MLSQTKFAFILTLAIAVSASVLFGNAVSSKMTSAPTSAIEIPTDSVVFPTGSAFDYSFE